MIITLGYGKLIKEKYKVHIYTIEENGEVCRTSIPKYEKPHINDYVKYFAPKLSTCYSIQFFELQEDNSYKMIESWIKSKRGWKKIPCLI